MPIVTHTHIHLYTYINAHICILAITSLHTCLQFHGIAYLTSILRDSCIRRGGKNRCRLIRGRESYLKEGEAELLSLPALSGEGGGTGTDRMEGTQILRKILSQTVISARQGRVLLCFPQCTQPWRVRSAEASKRS